MRVRLRGINKITKRLADGRAVTYYYAWKGGPPLRGKPGSPEFHASYNEAVARRTAPPQGVLMAVLRPFQQSPEFLGLAPRTRADYIGKIKLIEKQFGDFPLSALTDRRSRGVFMGWRDKLATGSRKQADYAFLVLARILSWGLDRGLVDANPCEKAGRLYRGSRADSVWTPANEAAFRAVAPPHMHLAIDMALWTGQRQGDLLKLPWSAYDGAYIRLRQAKTGARVMIPVGAPLKAALDATPRRSTLILTNTKGIPWTLSGFGQAWRKACADAGIVELTFHDLRGTAVTRLALAGATEAEIVTITGHSMKGAGAILDTHYLHRDPALAESAIAKLELIESRTNFPTERPTARMAVVGKPGKSRDIN
jgi:integrase